MLLATSAPPGDTQAVSALDYVDRDANVVVHLDADGLRRSAFLAAYEHISHELPRYATATVQARQFCGFDPISVIDKVAMSFNVTDGAVARDSMMLAATTGRSSDQLVRCLAAMFPEGKQAQLNGLPGLRFDDDWILVDRQTVLMGPGSRLTAAANATPSAERDLAHRDGAFLVASGILPNPLKFGEVRLMLSNVDDRLKLSATAIAEREEMATHLVSQADAFKLVAMTKLNTARLPNDVAAALVKVLQDTTIESNGQRIGATLSMANADVERLVSALVLRQAVDGQGGYVAEVEKARSEENLGRILAGLLRYMKVNRRIPPSAPRVPQQIPSNKEPIQTTGADFDHETWKLVGFQTTGPQYYAYEIETAADGQSVVVRALTRSDRSAPPSCWRQKIVLCMPGTCKPQEQMAFEQVCSR